MARQGISVKPPSQRVAGLLILRGVLSTAGMLCFYYSLTKLTFADATVLVYINPILTSVLGAVVSTLRCVVCDCTSRSLSPLPAVTERRLDCYRLHGDTAVFCWRCVRRTASGDLRTTI